MSERVYNHLKFNSKDSGIRYSGKPVPVGSRFPIRPNDYFKEKREELEEIKNKLKKQNKPFSTILKISGEAGKDLLFISLDSSKYNLRLLSIKEEWVNGEKIITANVQFKDETSFNKFSESLYTTRKEKNKNTYISKQSNLCITIDKIEELKSFKDLVTDYSLPENFDPQKSYWMEIWLPNDEGLFDEFINFLKKNLKDIIFNPRQLNLGDRNIALIKTNKRNLDYLSNQLSYIAEIRFAKKITHLLDLETSEKIEISDQLLSRIKINEDTNTTSVILDTGINRGHPFLESILSAERNMTLDEGWGKHDEAYTEEGKVYHGTGMAGLCAYGDFCDLITSNNEVLVTHNLTSVKIFSPNKPKENEILDSPANVISDAVNLVESNVFQNKNYVLASTTDDSNRGMPSSYSTSLDILIFDKKLLFMVSVGNNNSLIMPSSEVHAMNQLSTCVEDPSQSWNSLSIGAYTTKVDCSNLRNEGLNPLSESGDVSPHTKFSMVDYKNDNLPLKPEVLFEGGNLAINHQNIVGMDSHFDLITTNYDFQNTGNFANFNATSAATALAGRFASILMEEYPEYWPETIKGLMVHSAEWTEAMLRKRLLNSNIRNNSGDNKVKFLRQCGFGVPNLERAKKSAQNSLTLISQNEFYLFNDQKKSQCISFDLPWPTEVLENLSDKKISLKITLSYFIAPKAGSRGNKNKFKYQSHGFRFGLKRKDETEEAFHKRVNNALKSKEESLAESSSVDWLLGEKVRNKVAGTVLKDMWKGKSIDLASMDKLIIYPVNGWWKDDKTIKPEDSKVRFSLIVDIETEEENVNLYNEIKSILEIRSNLEISIPAPIR